MAENGNGTFQKIVYGIAGTIVSTAIIAAAAFSFTTSRNVAVIAERVKDIQSLEERLRAAELKIERLEAKQ